MLHMAFTSINSKNGVMSRCLALMTGESSVVLMVLDWFWAVTVALEVRLPFRRGRIEMQCQ